ncbi:MAG: PEP-CTERM sorting domain-containing protein [Acidobacteriota bacterium]
MSTIGVTTDLSDPNQGLLYLTDGADALAATTSVSVGGGATPEPGTVLLTLLSSIPFWFFRRHISR